MMHERTARTQPNPLHDISSHARVREALDILFEPALTYAEAPPARRRMQDLQASLMLPVDLVTAGFLVRLAPAEPEGFKITVTLPPSGDLPTITASGEGPTWCAAVSELASRLRSKIDRVERDLQQAAEPVEAA